MAPAPAMAPKGSKGLNAGCWAPAPFFFFPLPLPPSFAPTLSLAGRPSEPMPLGCGGAFSALLGRPRPPRPAGSAFFLEPFFFDLPPDLAPPSPSLNSPSAWSRIASALLSILSVRLRVESNPASDGSARRSGDRNARSASDDPNPEKIRDAVHSRPAPGTRHGTGVSPTIARRCRCRSRPRAAALVPSSRRSERAGRSRRPARAVPRSLSIRLDAGRTVADARSSRGRRRTTRRSVQSPRH